MIFTALRLFVKWVFGALGTTEPETFNDDRVANDMRNSAGVDEAREKYYSKGLTHGTYVFGIQGLLQAGYNPIQQFVGSFNWQITVSGNNLVYTLTNKTDLRSADYHITPASWDLKNGAMGDFYQTYIFSEPLRK